LCSSVTKTSSGIPTPQNRPLVPQNHPSTPTGTVPPSLREDPEDRGGREHETPFLNAARIPRVAGGAVIVIGLGALAGWRLDVAWLKRFAPGQATMSPAAALGLVFLGIALWLSSQRGVSRAVAWAADACAAATALLGLVRLSGYLLGFDPGVDHLLFAQQVDAAAGPPSRLAFQTALNLLLVGAAGLLQRPNTLRPQVGVQLLRSEEHTSELQSPMY